MEENKITTEVSRRDFLRGTGLGILTLLADPGAAFSKIHVVEEKVRPVVLAVWNGAISQRDGEKSVSTWAFLKIEARQ